MVIGVYWLRSSRSGTPLEQANVISPSLDLLDTPAVIHTVLAILKYGDRVDIMKRSGNWARVRVADGGEGWVDSKELAPAKVYDEGLEIARQLSIRPVQATGHAVLAVNIHTEPARDAPELGLISEGQNLDVYDRRLVARKTPDNGGGQTNSTVQVRDAWYLVRSGPLAGWVLGRMVTLDIPQAISHYAAEHNTVAWFVLNTVRDGDASVPQYLVADRDGTADFDFTHIRVFTWWVKRHHYVTSYVQSGLNGVFPIRVEHLGNVPYFRLRLVDDKGNKIQAVYGLYDTIVRRVGTIDGWESNVIPERRRGG